MVSSGDQWAEWLTDYFAISWRLGESRCCDAQRCRFFAESVCVCVCVCVCVQTGRRGSRGLYVTCWSAFFFSPSLLRGGHDSLRRDWSPHPWYSPWYPRMLHIAADILWNMLFYVKIKWLFLMFMGRALSFIMQWFVLLRQGFEVWWSHRQTGKSSLSKVLAEKCLIEFRKTCQVPRVTVRINKQPLLVII